METITSTFDGRLISCHDLPPKAIIFGQSEGMKGLWQIVEKVASASVPILILGERGSGKEILARFIRSCNPGSVAPFLKVSPTITSWKEFVAVLLDVDFLIASRLRGVILGFVSETPSVAISPDPKVDWVMGDLGLTDYLLHIGEFTSADVMEALDKLMLRRNDVIDQIATYRDRIHDLSAAQYGALAELAVEKGRHRC